MNDDEAMHWGSILMQAAIFKPVNFRLSNSFHNQAKYMYELGVSEIKKPNSFVFKMRE